MSQVQSYCLFRSGTLALAVGVEHVAEVVETDAIVPISGCPPSVVGLCPHHRQVIPVVSLAPAGDVPRVRSNRSDRRAVLILRTAQGPWGIDINRDAMTITTGVPTSEEPERGEGAIVTLGKIGQGDADFALLDPESTWQLLRESVVEWYADTADAVPTAESGPSASGESSARPVRPGDSQ
ncbi:MAG: chemotaxis protein CheW [Isosphaeraceae bacterium]